MQFMHYMMNCKLIFVLIRIFVVWCGVVVVVVMMMMMMMMCVCVCVHACLSILNCYIILELLHHSSQLKLIDFPVNK